MTDEPAQRNRQPDHPWNKRRRSKKKAKKQKVLVRPKTLRALEELGEVGSLAELAATWGAAEARE